MTLAYVQAIVAGFVGLIASLTGLLMAVALLLPLNTGKAEKALDQSPVRCFLSGLGMLIVLIFALVCLNIPVPLIKLVGFVLTLGLVALGVLGGAGLAQLMGRRIGEMSGARTSFGCLVRGSLVYSIGVLFPYAGWFLLAPLSMICALGAGLSAVWPTPRPMQAAPLERAV